MTIPTILLIGGLAGYLIGLAMIVVLPTKAEWIGAIIAGLAAIAIVAGVVAGMPPT